MVSCFQETRQLLQRGSCTDVHLMLTENFQTLKYWFVSRKVNGPGTPRPFSRPKGSLASSLAANGLPDSTDNKDLKTEQDDGKESRSRRTKAALMPEDGEKRFLLMHLFFSSHSEVSASEDSPGSSVKNKHADAEEDMDADQQEVKRLKFSKEEEDEEEQQEVETLRPSRVACVSKEADAMVHEEVEYSKENEASTCAPATEDQGEARLSSC